MSDVGGRFDLDRVQPPCPRAFDILGEIVEEQNARGRHADRFDDVIISCRVRFSKPDRGREIHFAEMPKQIRVGCREMFDMRSVGVGEGVKRQAFCGPRQKPLDVGHLAGEDRVPALKKLRVGNGDAERGAQAVEIVGIADPADLVMPVRFAAYEAFDDVGRRATGMRSPAGDRLAEIDVEDDAAEIEQQGIGGAGREAGSGHGGREMRSKSRGVNTGTARSPAAGMR